MHQHSFNFDASQYSYQNIISSLVSVFFTIKEF